MPSQTLAMPPRHYLNENYGISSWLLTRDHKRIGLLFLGCVVAALFLGGVFAMLIRIELLTPDETIMTAQTYNRMFTLHGLVMIFLFMIPAIPSGFGNFVLLQAELLDAYALALIQAAKDEPEGLGSMAEEDVREGRFRMPQAERLADGVLATDANYPRGLRVRAEMYTATDQPGRARCDATDAAGRRTRRVRVRLDPGVWRHDPQPRQPRALSGHLRPGVQAARSGPVQPANLPPGRSEGHRSHRGQC